MKRSSRFFTDPYIQINTILAGVIVAILIYSGIFTAASNYPVHSYYESATGKVSPSSGLSRAFSEIVRLNFDQAQVYNPYSLRIFSFFALQLILRLLFSWLAIAYPSYGKKIVLADMAISTSTFLYAFSPFLQFLYLEIAQKL